MRAIVQGPTPAVGAEEEGVHPTLVVPRHGVAAATLTTAVVAAAVVDRPTGVAAVERRLTEAVPPTAREDLPPIEAAVEEDRPTEVAVAVNHRIPAAVVVDRRILAEAAVVAATRGVPVGTPTRVAAVRPTPGLLTARRTPRRKQPTPHRAPTPHADTAVVPRGAMRAITPGTTDTTVSIWRPRSRLVCHIPLSSLGVDFVVRGLPLLFDYIHHHQVPSSLRRLAVMILHCSRS